MLNIEKINLFRKKIKSKEIAIGSWLQISNACIAEIIGRNGYDWIAVDLEHGSFSRDQ